MMHVKEQLELDRDEKRKQLQHIREEKNRIEAKASDKLMLVEVEERNKISELILIENELVRINSTNNEQVEQIEKICAKNVDIQHHRCLIEQIKQARAERIEKAKIEQECVKKAKNEQERIEKAKMIWSA